MKRSHSALGLFLLLGLMAHSADARYPEGGHGVAGRVVRVADRYFIFDTNNGEVKVFISANTTFQDHGRRSDPSVVKEGLACRVTGHILSDGIWESWKVNVTER